MQEDKRKTNPILLKEYEDFIRFTSLSWDERDELFGYHFNGEFAKKYKVDPSTLTRWRRGKDFWERVRELVNEWAKDKTPIVVKKHFTKILKDPASPEIKLWYQRFDNFTEKQETTFVAHRATLQAIQDNTRALIDQEDKKSKKKSKKKSSGS